MMWKKSTWYLVWAARPGRTMTISRPTRKQSTISARHTTRTLLKLQLQQENRWQTKEQKGQRATPIRTKEDPLWVDKPLPIILKLFLLPVKKRDRELVFSGTSTAKVISAKMWYKNYSV